jgi:hypothetical protein
MTNEPDLLLTGEQDEDGATPKLGIFKAIAVSCEEFVKKTGYHAIYVFTEEGNALISAGNQDGTVDQKMLGALISAGKDAIPQCPTRELLLTTQTYLIYVEQIPPLQCIPLRLYLAAVISRHDVRYYRKTISELIKYLYFTVDLGHSLF